MSRPQIFSIEKLGKARIEQLYELNNLPLPSFTNIKFLREDIILILDDEDEQNYNNSREVDRFFNDDVNHSNVDRVGNLDNDNIDNDNNNIDNDNLDNDNLDNDNLFNDNLDNDNLDNDNLDNDNLDYDNIDNDKIDNIDKVDNITSKDNDNDNENSQINEVVLWRYSEIIIENIIFSADGKGLSFSKFKHLLLLVHGNNLTKADIVNIVTEAQATTTTTSTTTTTTPPTSTSTTAIVAPTTNSISLSSLNSVNGNSIGCV
ncbi:hypothetical protein DDB_G0283213 [Dictyostelium discoideum AX4]|uniref:Uncharacterized protein n=1 Tax=Dictyostelium discoideum TaxID=44689 RepID=Q54RH2_DICDI|nr:hypothetical protein DDB_G0283213 [Dictyostelium discoideum AX4]EAL65845.1 hypothetical protein DDB_G0283213 [Dictyostelium discoideum AX4]|eukprot:XP_639173.1 hypothetical protein DDB_G0283213 [Dictyostelium discoideum AX4]